VRSGRGWVGRPASRLVRSTWRGKGLAVACEQDDRLKARVADGELAGFVGPGWQVEPIDLYLVGGSMLPVAAGRG
jgi:hypothetical protein